MDIQLLVNATSGRATAGGEKGKAQGEGGDFASNLAGASRARQDSASEGSHPSAGMPSRQAGTPAQPLDASLKEASLKEAGRPAGPGLGVVGREALLSGVSRQGEGAQQGPLPGLGLESAGHQAAMASLSEGEVEAAIKALEGTDLQSGEGWEALQKRLDLIEQAGRLETGEDLAILPLAAQAVQPGSIRPEGGSLRDAGNEPRGNALLQAIATDTLERKGLRQSLVTQLDQTAERAGTTLEAVTRQAAVPSDELPQRFSVANDTLMAARTDTKGSNGGFELVGQGMAPSTASAASPSAQASIQAPVSSPAWPQQLGQQLVRLSQGGGEQRVELQLHPAELGPLSVSLKMGDQGAQAQFLSANAQVRQALEQAIPQLREALAEQGISLGETSVGEQRNGNGDEAQGQPGGMLAAAEVDEGSEGAPGASDGKVRDLSLDGRVDLYA
ncbi:flagellar hook-length control protein FliK [Halomonas daqiaonensis]|uniref:Hook-length control protein FliK n=1 Tax=Halomonas daqiaonensis TaxID=650850 RepID=A0A1H7SNM7_9GAMM|nr:flagellar hook-length control protein FliK [Halomonas daqiaonensis]SEL74078.1 hook-length control protein FliK [Halomonas daqiaonensis]